MSAANQAPPISVGPTEHEHTPSKQVVLREAANEIIFGVVGHVGSGTSKIASTLCDLLRDKALPGGEFRPTIIKASKEIQLWAAAKGRPPLDRTPGHLDGAEELQSLGNELRSLTNDQAAVARRLVLKIRRQRALLQETPLEDDNPIVPDGVRRAWILDSLRHPAEVELLRHIYQDAFVLIGVVCEEDARKKRLQTKFSKDGSPDRLATFMQTDADEPSNKFGQKVADTFHMSDCFVNNSEDHKIASEDWDVSEQLGRLIKILTHSEIVRPTPHETAMHAAYGAQLRSACLSRQVGAALVNVHGQLVSTGTNEVPRFHGGLYGQQALHPIVTQTRLDVIPDRPVTEARCAFQTDREKQYCSNTREQKRIVQELVDHIEREFKSEHEILPPKVKMALLASLRKSRVGGLLEFSRAVHAEMDALLAATRSGVSPVGGRLYVTTFPCHYCARHIVASGVIEVQYIEPYPKSLATRLHDDAICTTESERDTKVLFRPFSGITPRLYRRAFMKDRPLKDKSTGNKSIGIPPWGTPWHLRRVSYVKLEAELAAKGNDDA